MIAFFTDLFYNVIIAWSLYYLFASFSPSLPWTSCNNTWNIAATCYDEHIREKLPSMTSDAAKLIDNDQIGDGNFGIDNIGSIQWKLAVCLALVVWFTAIFPYCVLLIFLIRGVTLEGSMMGIYYYMYPNLSELLNSKPWIDAATQVFFSLGPGFGVLLAFASYNKFNNNVYKDALITSAVNCMTSFLSGFVVFAIIGYLAHKRKEDVRQVISDDQGLVFTVYPEALATLPGSTFWSLCFFLMLMTLGLDSSFGGSEAIITGISDEFPIFRRNRELFILGLFAFYYAVGLTEITQGGMFVLNLLERFSVQYSILLAVLFETMCISWIYGVDRFRENIREMTGFLPGMYWKLCWKFLAPVFIIFNISFGLYQHEPLSLGPYKYPAWANIVGWMLAASSIIWIPGVAVVQLCTTPGSFRERLRFLLTPQLGAGHQSNGCTERAKVADTEEDIAVALQAVDFELLKEDAV
uniref:Sodium-and chloride-dependent GABA transporter 2 n=1 Tax=Macrostomum lignano TaxID=282301 RepID=A0A1I8JIY4_9PLAT